MTLAIEAGVVQEAGSRVRIQGQDRI